MPKRTVKIEFEIEISEEMVNKLGPTTRVFEYYLQDAVVRRCRGLVGPDKIAAEAGRFVESADKVDLGKLNVQKLEEFRGVNWWIKIDDFATRMLVRAKIVAEIGRWLDASKTTYRIDPQLSSFRTGRSSATVTGSEQGHVHVKIDGELTPLIEYVNGLLCPRKAPQKPAKGRSRAKR